MVTGGLRRFFGAAAACLIFLVMLEGLGSTISVASDLVARSRRNERTLSGPSVQYDPELGWVSVPNFLAKDYFAPGVPLQTNSRGFRASREFSPAVPAGKLRVICSGDSFTFGEGVANNRTWCQTLESIDPRLETVNASESGYGIDQMYLWYRRSAQALDHDVQILAFIGDDFRRVGLSSIGGYNKPVLEFRQGKLVRETPEVPKSSWSSRWAALKPNPLRGFRSIAMLADLADWMVARRKTGAENPPEQQRQVVAKIIEDLQTVNAAKRSVLVLLYLPTRADSTGETEKGWHDWIRAEAAKRNLIFIDLLDDFRSLPITAQDGLFIWAGSHQNFAESAGHYDDQGNEYVARRLYQKLMLASQVEDKLLNLDARPVARP
jgi:hypothetical protein